MRSTWLVGLVVAAMLGCGGSSNTRGSTGGSGDGAGDGTGDPNNPSGTDGNTGGDGRGNGGDGSGESDGGGVCNRYAVRNDRVTPDMLIVLDKSGSMDPGQNGGIDRWGGSVSGIKAITAALDSTIEFGLMAFPSDDQCGAGTIQVEIGPKKASAIATALDSMGPDGATPTAVSLDAARNSLGSTVVAPDELVHPKYVILVTDGAPNCGSGGNLPPMPSCPITDLFLNPGSACAKEWQNYQNALTSSTGGDVDATVAAVEALAKDGIKTYVLGFGTQSDAQLKSALDRMAVAGDTGDTEHRPIEDEASIEKQFNEIAGKAISCDYVLEDAVSDPAYVLVKVDGKQLNLGEADGWLLSADKKKITVQGAACKTLQDNSQKHVLSVEVLCEVVVPI